MTINLKLAKLPYLSNCFLLVFFIFGILLINRHEMWLDETQPWLLARDSTSFPDLLYNKRYDGHPALWYSLLFMVTKFTLNLKALQILHIVLITGFVFIFLKSGFNLYFKILFCSGYYILYEYAAITRLYALELLLAGLACYVYTTRKKNFFLLLLLLFLLAQANLFGLIFSSGLLLLLLYEQDFISNKKSWLKYAGITAVLAGYGFAIYSMKPPPDDFFAAGWNFHWNLDLLKNLMGSIWHSFVPFPALYVEFWNTNFIRSPEIKTVLGLMVYVWTFTFFTKSPKILILYVFITVSTLLFFYLKYLGTTRHQGHLFIFFIFCLWLLPTPQNPFSPGYQRNYKPFIKLFSLYLILVVNVGAGFFAAAVDWVYPFAPNKQTAQFLENLPYSFNLVAENNFHPSPIAAYLNRKIYYANTQRFGSYYQTSYEENQKLTDYQTIQTGVVLTKKTNQVSVVILDKELRLNSNKNNKIKKIFKSDNTILGKPVYHLYLISL